MIIDDVVTQANSLLIHHPDAITDFSLIKSLSSFYTLYYKPDVNFIQKATKTGQKSCLIVNFYYLPLNVYVDACLEENRELVIKNLNTLYVVPDHPFVVIGKF